MTAKTRQTKIKKVRPQHDTFDLQYFSPKVADALTRSAQIAYQLGDPYIGPEHFILAILDEPQCIAYQVLDNLQITTELRTYIKNCHYPPPHPPTTKIPVNKNLIDIMFNSQGRPTNAVGPKISTADILRSLIQHPNMHPAAFFVNRKLQKTIAQSSFHTYEEV